MDALETLPAQVAHLALQVSQFRDDVAREFSAVRQEFRGEMVAQGEALRGEMAAQGAELRAEMAAQGETLRGEMAAQGDQLRCEIREGDEETRRYMRVLHEEVIGRLGEVYRARDTKLGRDVAVKILPEAFARDPHCLMRFEREARTPACLNHPHIAQLYGIEDSGTTRALVMELVAGEAPEWARERGIPTVLARGAVVCVGAAPGERGRPAATPGCPASGADLVPSRR